MAYEPRSFDDVIGSVMADDVRRFQARREQERAHAEKLRRAYYGEDSLSGAELMEIEAGVSAAQRVTALAKLNAAMDDMAKAAQAVVAAGKAAAERKDQNAPVKFPAPKIG